MRPLVIYTDSISHRIAALLHTYPTEYFTAAQLVDAASRPMGRGRMAPVRPSREVTQARGSRTCATQVSRLLAVGLMVRRMGEGPLIGRRGVPLEQYLYAAGPTPLAGVRLLCASGVRPGDTPPWRKG